jgi:hypothetical protein
MSDEKETKLSQDELKQVAGGKPAAKELSPEELNKVTGGLNFGDIKGQSTEDKHKDWIE